MQRLSGLISRAALMGALTLVAVTPALARQTLNSSISGYADTSDRPTLTLNAPASTTTLIVSQTRTQNSINTDATASASGMAQTDYGINKAFARATATGDSDLFSSADADVTAISFWEDTVTVNLAGQTGQAGTIMYSFAVDGSRLDSGPGFNNRQFLIKQNGTTVEQLSNNEADGTVSSGVLNIVYGTPFTISAALTVRAATFSSELPEVAEADYFNTATVTAITSLGDGTSFGSGSTYSGAIITNTGGVVVPESGTLALTLGALCSVLGVAVTRRRK